MESLDVLEDLENEELLVLLVQEDPLAWLDFLVLRDTEALMEKMAQRVIPVLLVLGVNLAVLETMAHLDQRVQGDKLVKEVDPEVQDQLVPVVMMELQVLLDNLDLLAPLEMQDSLVALDPRVKLDLQALEDQMVLLVLEVNKDPQAQLVQQALLVLLAEMAIQATKEKWALLVFLVPLVWLVLGVFQAHQAQMELLV